MTTADVVVAQQVVGVVEALRDALGAHDASVTLLDREERLRPVGASGAHPDPLQRGAGERRSGPGFEALRTGAPVAVVDLAESAWSTALDLPPGARGLLCVPIVVGRIPAGNVNLVTERPRSWSDRDIQRAEAAAAAVASLLQVAAGAGGTGVATSAVEAVGGSAGDGKGSDR